MAADGGTDRRGDEPDGPPTDDADAIERDVEGNAAARLTFFCDAVVAIAITLLALDLPVPRNADTNQQVLADMAAHFDEYLAFLISFVVIAFNWRTHHWVFRYLSRVDGRLFAYSLLWLLMMVSTPFATRVLTADGGFLARFALYASVQAVAALAFLLMTHRMERASLCVPGTPRRVLAASYRRSWGTVLTFGLSIPVALQVGAWAYACWALTPLVINLVRRVHAGRAPRP